MEELWHIQHEDGAARIKHTISNLKGFYVKAAQIVAARADLFRLDLADLFELTPVLLELLLLPACSFLFFCSRR